MHRLLRLMYKEYYVFLLCSESGRRVMYTLICLTNGDLTNKISVGKGRVSTLAEEVT